MSNFFSGRNKDSSSRILLESDEAGELAAHFQNENTNTNRRPTENEQDSKSWTNFIGVKTGVFAAKAMIAILLLLFLLNVVITFVNWKSMSSSSSIEKIQLDQSNVNFSLRLEQIRTEFETNWRNFTGKTLKVLGEQKRRLDTSENNSKLSSSSTEGKIQDLERKLQNLDLQVKTAISNYTKTNSNLSSEVNLIEENILKLSGIIDDLHSQIQSQGGSGNGNGTRLEFTQEIWRDGKTGLVLSQEISPQQNLNNRVEELRSKLEQLKTLPAKFYSEDRKVLFDLLYNSSSIRMERTDVCGGSFNFSTPAFLRYERSRQSNKEQPCVWVIWANSVVASSIKIRLLDLNGQLRIYNKFHIRSTNQAVQNWTSDNVLTEEVLDSNIAVVVFTPSPSASESGSGSSDVMELALQVSNPAPSMGDVKVTTLLVNSTSQRLTSSAGQYDDNERQFYIIYPKPGERVRLNVQIVNTEDTHDFLQLFKYDNSAHAFELIQRYSGRFFSYSLNVNHNGNVNQPMLMFFYTDASKTDEGFAVTVQSMTV